MTWLLLAGQENKAPCGKAICSPKYSAYQALSAAGS